MQFSYAYASIDGRECFDALIANTILQLSYNSDTTL